ncbi:MAG: TIGR02678 family protein [Erysipelotrichaceae bacterium]
MKTIEELLNRRWVLKSKDADLYYRIKDDSKQIKQIMSKLGYTLIVKQNLIKLEKIPAKKEAWMGIKDFQSNKEYQMFCYLLMYLEDKEEQEQFILSNLSEYIATQFEQGEIDWTNYGDRRLFVRVLKYAIDQSLLIQNDGVQDKFIQDENVEVLYENTGNSRYFMRNFTTDILKFNQYDDFFKGEWIDMDEDRGIVRQQRCYRKLILSLGVFAYDKNDEEDMAYIRNYRGRIERDLNQIFPCTLHVHPSCAFIVLDESSILTRSFPRNNAMDDLVLLHNQYVRKQIIKKRWDLQKKEEISLEKEEYVAFLRKIIKEVVDKLPKSYQQDLYLTKKLYDYLKEHGWIIEEETKVLLLPTIAKISGNY